MFTRLEPTNHPRLNVKAKDAQWLLSGRNRHQQRTYGGNIDGLYGVSTGHAADRMRYWLGYAKPNQDGAFGPLLYSYLVANNNPAYKKLPLANRLRRKQRLAAEAKRKAAEKALLESPKRKALAQALTKVGVHEIGHTNWNEFGKWYGFNGVAWCAEFVSWAFRDFKGGAMKTALARQFMYWAREGRFGLRITYHPEPGDIVVYDHGQGHVGIFVDGDARHFRAVEGNTSCSGGSWDNGGEVCVQNRDRSRNPVFVRVP